MTRRRDGGNERGEIPEFCQSLIYVEQDTCMAVKEDPIVAEINALPVELDNAKEHVRALLGQHKAKDLRKACTRLRLGVQRRDSVHDNKQGYIDLLWSYYKTKRDSVVDALEGPRTVVSSEDSDLRVTRHCRFRLMNVIFSDTFIGRMGRIPDRRALDEGAVNDNSAYWVDVAKAYNEDTTNYNNFAMGCTESRYDGIDASNAVPHSASKLRNMWKKTKARFDKALYTSKKSRSHGEFWEYCSGHTDALYLADWLKVRGQSLDTVLGLIPKGARMSIVEGNASTSENLSHSSEDEHTAKRPRRMTTAERILEALEKDREEALAEREQLREQHQQEREEQKRGESMGAVVDVSVAVDAAMNTVDKLRSRHASESQVDAAARVLDKLVGRWQEAMEQATSE